MVLSGGYCPVTVRPLQQSKCLINANCIFFSRKITLPNATFGAIPQLVNEKLMQRSMRGPANCPSNEQVRQFSLFGTKPHPQGP